MRPIASVVICNSSNEFDFATFKLECIDLKYFLPIPFLRVQSMVDKLASFRMSAKK